MHLFFNLSLIIPRVSVITGARRFTSSRSNIGSATRSFRQSSRVSRALGALTFGSSRSVPKVVSSEGAI